MSQPDPAAATTPTPTPTSPDLVDPGFDSPPDRRGTGSLKWDKFAGRDVLPFWVADMDFVSPRPIVDAMLRRIEHGVFGYGRPHPSMEQVTLDYLRACHGVEAGADEIVWLPGVVPALNMACRAAGEQGDEVLTCTPVYPPFLTAPANADRKLVPVPLRWDGEKGHHTFDFDALEAAVTPRTRLFILCNPHNPTGRVYRRAELDQLFAFCERHGLLLCSDEIHCDLILEPGLEHISTPAVVKGTPLADRTISLFSPSKTYNIAGMAFAYAHIPDATLRSRFRRAGQGFLSEINDAVPFAAEAAYRDCEPWRQRLVGYLRGNRDALYDFVAREMSGVHTAAPLEATYLAWLDVRELGLADPVAHFEEHGVGLSDGRFFGLPGYVRFNFGCSRALMMEGLQRMRAALPEAAGS